MMFLYTFVNKNSDTKYKSCPNQIHTVFGFFKLKLLVIWLISEAARTTKVLLHIAVIILKYIAVCTSIWEHFKEVMSVDGVQKSEIT